MAGDCEIGMVGLGTMGRNLLLNIADHGFRAAGHDLDPKKVALLVEEAGGRPIRAAERMKDFLDFLAVPRAVMMLVPAGPPVDAVIRSLLPFLSPGDTIIDGGNSHHRDTDLRARVLAERGLDFLGVGISGGEHGARHGASLMPGGPRHAYERVRAVLEAVAADSGGEPCISYLGPGSAGHYVKMVHNGIEYGLMELIAESYDLLKRGLGRSDDAIAQDFDLWDRGLDAYLLEITARIFRQVDGRTGKRLVDVILDEARQKGTGMWTSQDGMELRVPLPTIDAAVSLRDLSALKEEREAASRVLEWRGEAEPGEAKGLPDRLRGALEAGMLITFAQGMALLREASKVHGYGLSLEQVARVWRGGCIIRTSLLEDIRAACRARPDLPNILLDPKVSTRLQALQGDLRAVVRHAAARGIPASGFMASLAYLDGSRSAWLPANLIQAQRDYFGAHTYERIDDEKGMYHTRWSAE